MSLHIQLSEEFGSFLADGEKAAAFRYAKLDPFVHYYDQFILDFSGVRNMNSSFANALIANLISQNPEVLAKVRFTNCNPAVKISVESALMLGVERLRNKIPARMV